MKINTSVFERVDCDKDHQHIRTGKKKCPVSWWARLRYVDPETNRPKDLQRRATSKANANDIATTEAKRIEATGGRSVKAKTFADLCNYYEKDYAKPAKYVEHKHTGELEKVSGLRSLYTVQRQIETLKEYFGPRMLDAITHGAIRQFKNHRFDVPTRAGRQRSIASVHRELALLRRMLNVALGEGWITSNPFKSKADNLISPASERQRERIITQTEENALLAACDKPKRGHLKAIVIAALDTGCRRGELLKLRWHDVDFHRGQIRIIKFNSKTAKPRAVPMSARLRIELDRLWSESAKDPSLPVFGGKLSHDGQVQPLASVKKSFVGARRDAGLPDVRMHDLRHTALTRLHRRGLSIGEVAAIGGHDNIQTTKRYLNADSETIDRATAILDSFNAGEVQPSETASELVN